MRSSDKSVVLCVLIVRTVCNLIHLVSDILLTLKKKFRGTLRSWLIPIKKDAHPEIEEPCNDIVDNM